jgi:hypothetical protein
LIARYFACGKIEEKVGSDQRFRQIDRAIGVQGPSEPITLSAA